MIIVDNKSKDILELNNNKLKRLDGNWNDILKVITKYYDLINYIDNLYIYYYPCFKKLDINKSIHIVSIIHQKTFVVSPKLSMEVDINKVLGRLFAFEPVIIQKINQVYDIQIYGDILYPRFQNIEINTIEDLWKNCILTKTIKMGYYWKSNSWIALQYLYDESFSKNHINISIGSGLSSYKNTSKAKSISEVLERFSAGIPGRKIFKYSSQNIAYNIIDLMLGNQDLKDHYGLYPIVDLFTKDKFLLPGNILFYPYTYSSLWNANSNGMSSHISSYAAIESALFELIERDSFVLLWLIKKGGYLLVKDEKIISIIDSMDIKDYDIQLFVIKFDNPVPVVLSIIRDGQKISCSMGTGYSLYDAVEKALMELNQFGKQNIKHDQDEAINDNSIEMHILYYLNDNNFDKVSWFYDLDMINVSDAQNLFEPIDNLNSLISYYNHINTHLYKYTYKNPVLKVFKRYCVRVISDNLLYIWFGKKVPDPILKSKRLKYRKKYFNVKSLNLEIHPFG